MSKIIDVPITIVELLKSSGGSADAWQVPEDLVKPLRPVMKFDEKKLLPEPLRKFCADVSYRMQCPTDFVAVALVTMLGSVIGAGCAVRPKQNDDWTEVPNLWGGVVGRPGKLKTPAISAGFSGLRVLDSDAERDHQDAMNAHQMAETQRKFAVDIAKKSIAKIKDTGALESSEDLKTLFALQHTIPEPPKLRRHYSNDGTVEKLGEILSANHRGLMVYRDELMGLLMAFEQQGHEGDRAFYLEAWNGKYSHRVDRIGRGEIYIPRLCLSVFGGIQPAKLHEYIANSWQSGNDGFLQRFQLLVYPDEIDSPKIIDQAPDREASEAVVAIVRLLASTDFAGVGAQRDFDEAAPYFRFESGKTQAKFFDWLQSLDSTVSDEEHPIVQEHLIKFRKLVPTLALIFHLVEHAHKKTKHVPPIAMKNLKLALNWAAYLESHARRVYSIGLNASLTAAQSLARKLKKGELTDGFSERDVQRKGWANLTDIELTRLACRELDAAGWIRRRKEPRKNGRPPSPSYEINPAVKNNPA